MTPLPETPAYIRVMVRQLLRERGKWRKRLNQSKRYTDLYRKIKHELAVAGQEVGDFELERILMSYNRRPTEDEALDVDNELFPTLEDPEHLDDDPAMSEGLREIVEEVMEGLAPPAEEPAKPKRGGKRGSYQRKTDKTGVKALASDSPAAVIEAATAPPAPPLPAIQTTAGPGGLAIFRMTIETNLPGFEELVKALAERIGVECR